MSGTTTPDITNYNALLTTYDHDSGNAISYICEIHTNDSSIATVEYFYDLVHSNCGVSSSNSTSSTTSEPLSIAYSISEQLVLHAAEIWNILPNGDACTVPQDTYNTWLFGVSTTSFKNNTKMITDFGCQQLIPNTTLNECCHVIRSEMIFRPTGSYNVNDLKLFVQESLNVSSFSVEYRTASIEPKFIEDTPLDDDPRNNLKEPNRTNVVPPTSNSNAITQQSSSNESDITVTGGFLIASLVTVVFGVFVVLFRRYRKTDHRRMDESGRNVDDTFQDKDDDFQVTVVNDHNYNSFPVKRQVTCQSCYTEMEGGNEVVESQLLDDNNENDEYDHPMSTKYAFDLSQSLKQNVMGTYASKQPTVIPVVAPYPLGIDADISCDSEAEDSWAQTDGTVGSLEEHLEEITAEI
jgi:hypothetical protein